MLAGFSEIDITPKSGNMPGQFGIFKSTEGTIGGLYANVAAFTNKETSIILISVDIILFTAKYGFDIRNRISSLTGVPTANIIVAATHTHTGGPIDFQAWGTPAEPEKAAVTADKIVEAAVAAWNNRSEAKLGVGRCYEPRFSFCRDYCMADGKIKTNVGYAKAPQIKGRAGNVDYALDVMRIDDAEGNIKCFIVNYANHPDNEPMPRNKYSADYIGYLRRELKRIYGDDVTVLYFNGTAGDVNAADFWHSTDAWYKSTGNTPKVIGEELAKDITVINPHIVADVEEPYIAAVAKTCIVPTRKPKQENLDWAESVKDKRGTGELKDYEEAYAEVYLNYVESEWHSEEEIEIPVIRFGPWSIVGLGGEIYSEIGLRIKRDSPYENTLVFELANSAHGYIPPASIMETATYPAKWGRHVTYLGAETADILIENSLEILNDMKKTEKK